MNNKGGPEKLFCNSITVAVQAVSDIITDSPGTYIGAAAGGAVAVGLTASGPGVFVAGASSY